MEVKLLTLRFDPRIGGFDERPLQEAVRGREVVSVREHFFVHEEVPHWAFLLTWRIPDADGEPAASERGKPRRDGGDYRKLLQSEDWPLFNQLRDWRSGVAGEEGVPPYIIVPNDTLARIARERPQTLNALGQIRGMGAARLKRHGRAILAALGAATPEEPRGDDGAASEPAGEGGGAADAVTTGEEAGDAAP